jgi:hypothetical protein
MRRWWRRRQRTRDSNDEGTPRNRSPLREFIYLDDVSLRSLLASQKGELTDQVTLLLSQADEAELASSIGASSPVLKAEASYRYQATSSRGSQTSRKAVVQSLFKELRELDWIDVVLQPMSEANAIDSVEDLISAGPALSATELRRGVLVEVEVELVADPIFRLSTIASELAEMTRDFPELLDQPGTRAAMAQIVPGNRLLQRFLAGLIPIRTLSTSHVVVQHDGGEWVVPTSVAADLSLVSQPLYIVGVTEQGSYWRDVRRVLFSGSRFTMLCRVARDGLSDSWEPVKLAEVLKEVLPTFPDVLADIGRTGLTMHNASEPPGPAPITAALHRLVDSVEMNPGPIASAAALAAARAAADDCGRFSSTTAGQNEAFRKVIAVLEANGCNRSGDEWLKLERDARAHSALALFDHGQRRSAGAEETTEHQTGDRLLDTEVIAIYW